MARSCRRIRECGLRKYAQDDPWHQLSYFPLNSRKPSGELAHHGAGCADGHQITMPPSGRAVDRFLLAKTSSNRHAGLARFGASHREPGGIVQRIAAGSAGRDLCCCWIRRLQSASFDKFMGQILKECILLGEVLLNLDRFREEHLSILVGRVGSCRSPHWRHFATIG